MRDLLLDRIRDAVRRYRLLEPGDRVIIGLSGGPDSVALSHLLPAVAAETGAAVVGLAHLNHQLRPSADDDEAFCVDLAGRLGLPIDVERADVRAAAHAARTSLEDGARRVRYAFLRRAAARLEARRVAVAHHRHDQAETVLLRLFRGAGTAGLAAIRPRAGAVIRPLIDTPRPEIERYLAAAGLSFREDPTNADLAIPRNRVRHELLPYLARHFGAGVVDVLARQATLARDDAAWLEDVATETARSLVLDDVGSPAAVSIAIAPLLALPPAIGRRVLRLALRRVGGDRFIGFAQVDAALALARDPAGPSASRAVIDLPGQRVKRIKGRLELTPRLPDPGRAGRRRGRPAAVPGEGEVVGRTAKARP